MARKPFQLAPAQRIIAEKELKLYQDALMHDHQYAIRRAVYLMQVLALPKRIKRLEALQQLTEELGRIRERNRWGRPWTVHQVSRIFYMKTPWRERPPKPVTQAEWRAHAAAPAPAGRITVDNGAGGKPRLRERGGE